MEEIIFTITGPSLSGKSTLEKILTQDGVMAKAISTTTRKQRQGEVNGVDYFFVSKDEFNKIEANGDMVESVEFDGNKYGVTKEEVKMKFATGAAVAIVVEPNGANQIKEYAAKEGWKCVRVLVTNPDEVLKQRFDQRLEGDALADPAVYAKRWDSMKTVEKQWVAQMSAAEMKFTRFDSETQEEVVASILGKLEEIKQATPEVKKRKFS